MAKRTGRVPGQRGELASAEPTVEMGWRTGVERRAGTGTVVQETPLIRRVPADPGNSAAGDVVGRPSFLSTYLQGMHEDVVGTDGKGRGGRGIVEEVRKSTLASPRGPSSSVPLHVESKPVATPLLVPAKREDKPASASRSTLSPPFEPPRRGEKGLPAFPPVQDREMLRNAQEKGVNTMTRSFDVLSQSRQQQTRTVLPQRRTIPLTSMLSNPSIKTLDMARTRPQSRDVVTDTNNSNNNNTDSDAVMQPGPSSAGNEAAPAASSTNKTSATKLQQSKDKDRRDKEATDALEAEIPAQFLANGTKARARHVMEAARDYIL